MQSFFINLNPFTWNLSVINLDAPEPWQIGFQDGGSPTQEGITELHDSIFFYLVVICFGVLWILSSTIINFKNTKSSIIYKYQNHGTLIELIWTITPALVLICIAFPSFKLLYLMDDSIININGCVLAIKIQFPSNLNKRKVSINYIPNNICKGLVLYGNVGSTLDYKVDNYSKNIVQLPKHIISQIVGHLPGDGNIHNNISSINPALMFSQGFKNFSYTFHVYQNLSHYRSRLPALHKQLNPYKNSKNKFIVSTQVLTRHYIGIINLYQIFYKWNGIQIIKCVTLNILPYLDEIALAY